MNTFGADIRAMFYAKVYDNFDPCGIFKKITSFLQILNQYLQQRKLMAVVNFQK